LLILLLVFRTTTDDDEFSADQFRPTPVSLFSLRSLRAEGFDCRMVSILKPRGLDSPRRDCERLALARGVRYHVEERVLVHGAKAIVFRD